MSDLAALTATDAIAAMREDRLDPVDYTTALLNGIERKNTDIQAWAHLSREQALEQATAVERHNSRRSHMPLYGIPVGVKDIIDTAGMPTENGTPLDAGRRPQADAAVIKLLRSAGAVIMGKTVTTELAFLSPSRTRNPRNIEHTPGGSSSGSAAAVAAGMVPIALGTQTNGSVIRPASFCGVYALKPTNGLFPRAGVLEESASFDTVGIFSRSIADLALVASQLAVGEEQGQPKTDYVRELVRPTGQHRFAFIKTSAFDQADPETREAFQKLASDLKGRCDEIALPPEFNDVIGMHRTVMFAEIALNFGHYFDRGKDQLSDAMQAAIEEGREMKAVAYADGLRAREVLYRRFAQLLEGYDAFITPPAAGPAPKGLSSTGNPVFCTMWTYLGVPALNLPLLSVAGMPLGIQVVGRRFDEGRLLRAASLIVNELTQKGYRDWCA